jgi:hypothetical protein
VVSQSFGSGSNMKSLSELVEKETYKTQPSAYGIRHLFPENLSPLRKKLKKQLADLKGINSQQQVMTGPFECRSGSRYLHSIIVSKD